MHPPRQIEKNRPCLLRCGVLLGRPRCGEASGGPSAPEDLRDQTQLTALRVAIVVTPEFRVHRHESGVDHDTARRECRDHLVERVVVEIFQPEGPREERSGILAARIGAKVLRRPWRGVLEPVDPHQSGLGPCRSLKVTDDRQSVTVRLFDCHFDEIGRHRRVDLDRVDTGILLPCDFVANLLRAADRHEGLGVERGAVENSAGGENPWSAHLLPPNQIPQHHRVSGRRARIAHGRHTELQKQAEIRQRRITVVAGEDLSLLVPRM